MHGNNFRVEQTRGRNTYEIDLKNARPNDRLLRQTIVDSSDSPAKILVNHKGNIKKENLSYLNKNLTIWLRDERTGKFWNPIFRLNLYCLREPHVELVYRDRMENIQLSKTRKYQFHGMEYKFYFLQDLTGTDREDMVKIMKPKFHQKTEQTIDMREGINKLMLTENLMNGYSIKPGGRTLQLKHYKDWVLEIRDPNSRDIRHDVIIKNIEQIISEYYILVLDMRDAFPDMDLGALYEESKELIPPE
ncbi:uncharacterized protein LOC116609421 [Nematostella vectensis]|uniref:uncharacterized protein LOC116609421 n=1 Tax=Nematostella vectensis TaxID=45351 RepID=UPI00139041A2|nr:uncharacterized protein LOC116609421 [Nematostella vectensis]